MPRLTAAGAPAAHEPARLVTQAVGTLGGALLLAAILFPWSGHGAGSSISARRLADLALSGTVEAWVTPWLGALIYLVPLAGALLLIGTGLGGRTGVGLGAAAVALAGTVTVAAVARLPRRSATDLGAGAKLAVLGLLAAALSVGAHAWTSTHLRPPDADPTT